MATLITGGSGFIGRNLIAALHTHREVFGDIINASRRPFSSPFITKSYPCDIGLPYDHEPEFECLRYIMKTYKPEYIFHLAGKATVKMEGNESFNILNDNILSTQKVCQWSPEGARVVLASSVIVYGDWMFDAEERPPHLSATNYKESDRTEPTSIYGITKRASEGILKHYTSTGRINGVSARICATVGRGLTHGVVYDFIEKITNNPILKALGSRPGSTKPYCYIDDLVNALLILGMNKRVSGEYNIVPNDSISIEQVAKSVMRGLNIDREIAWLGEEANWKGDNRLISVSNEKMKDLGWFPKYESSEAIVQAVKDMA
mgnify:CR=1 FL=1